ncbi:hypothetical protein EsHS_00004689 [Epichloe bromicola]
MARAMARKSSQPARQGFAIFDDCSPSSRDKHTTSAAESKTVVLGEISKGQSQNRATGVDIAASPPPTKSPRRESARLEARPTNKCQAIRLTPRAQRPQAHAETFEPLVAVPEESNSPVETEAENPAKAGGNQAIASQPDQEQQMVLTAELKASLEEQVEKHLAGQFEWIMTYPTGAGSHAAGDCVDEANQGRPSTITVYGCNMLPVGRRPGVSQASEEPSTDKFALLATALTKDSSCYPSMTNTKGIDSPDLGHLCQLPPPPYPGTPPKVPEVKILVEQAVSPSLTVTSEKSNSIVGGSSRTGSFSIPRIEDSLEELDKLEEELEAVHQVTRTRQYASRHEEPGHASPGSSRTKPPTPKAAKRVSIAGYSATVRVKPSQEKPPSLRRSASLTFRDKRVSQQGPLLAEGSRVETSFPQIHSAANRLGTPKQPVKSAKPPTVPKFELPGEAVARRLKEQREARLAQQAEAQKAQAPPAPKPRANKTLARPTFELPGEAISRRKREEREAKLRAEEEEARKRREFKARPVRQSIGAPTAPRETLTSRVRQSKPLLEANGDSGVQRKRLSVVVAGDDTHNPSMNNSPQSRGRNPGLPSTEASRATSASTGSGDGKRNSVSLEELTVQRQRGREILSKDNSYTQEKKKGKQEREVTAKMAREEAAERSRMASREWAEKKRRKELAAKPAKENQKGQKSRVQT